jgi:hypothetical protein
MLDENDNIGRYGTGSLTMIWSLAYVKATTHTNWDFLPKVLSLIYYTTLEGVLGVQRSREAQGTIICLFGLLFFSQK